MQVPVFLLLLGNTTSYEEARNLQMMDSASEWILFALGFVYLSLQLPQAAQLRLILFLSECADTKKFHITKFPVFPTT